MNKYFYLSICIFRTFLFLIFSNLSFTIFNLSELDVIKNIASSDKISLISSGVDTCNNFFQKNKNLNIDKKKFKNFFICKFSKKRNRFYIYMLAEDRNESLTLKENCQGIIKNWPWIIDHMDERLTYQKKEFLEGFYIDNLFNNEALNITKNVFLDEQLLNNKINNFILENKDTFTLNNKQNNILLEKEINKLNRIYKKVLNGEVSDLDILVKKELDKITRYKIFLNDIKTFKSYSCTWTPGKGIEPYIKLEKFIEFENI